MNNSNEGGVLPQLCGSVVHSGRQSHQAISTGKRTGQSSKPCAVRPGACRWQVCDLLQCAYMAQTGYSAAVPLSMSATMVLVRAALRAALASSKLTGLAMTLQRHECILLTPPHSSAAPSLRAAALSSSPDAPFCSAGLLMSRASPLVRSPPKHWNHLCSLLQQVRQGTPDVGRCSAEDCNMGRQSSDTADMRIDGCSDVTRLLPVTRPQGRSGIHSTQPHLRSCVQSPACRPPP